MDRLQQMFQMQLDLQIEHMGFDPRNLDPEGRKKLFLEMAYAMTDELHEAGNEISWKSWAKAEFLNQGAYGEELIDAWHFFMVLFLLGYPPGIPTEIIAGDFYLGYISKHKINVQRQVEGYTGVKCPNCHRDVAMSVKSPDYDNATIHRCICRTTYNIDTGAIL
jgi:hypothetical protein